jgi:hypothetical protein
MYARPSIASPAIDEGYSWFNRSNEKSRSARYERSEYQTYER